MDKQWWHRFREAWRRDATALMLGWLGGLATAILAELMGVDGFVVTAACFIVAGAVALGVFWWPLH